MAESSDKRPPTDVVPGRPLDQTMAPIYYEEGIQDDLVRLRRWIGRVVPRRRRRK